MSFKRCLRSEAKLMRLSCPSCRRIGKTGSAFEKFYPVPPCSHLQMNLRIQRNSKMPFFSCTRSRKRHIGNEKKKKGRKKSRWATYKTQDPKDPFLLEKFRIVRGMGWTTRVMVSLSGTVRC